MLVGFICFGLDLVNPYISILFVALGNAFLHVQGAEITLRVSAGKLAPSAIFVAGGSFGVVTGKLLGTTVGVLNTWRSQGRNPIPFIRWGNRIRYRREDVDRWMMENMIIPTK